MSTQFFKAGKTGYIKNKLLPASLVRFVYAIILLCICQGAEGQQKIPAPIPYSQADLEKLYSTCSQVREDTVNRICLSFLSSHNLRKNAGAFYGFCDAFKKLCLDKNNAQVHRRVRIIELQGRLRLDSATNLQVSKQFEDLFNEFMHDGDQAAALECLFELGKFPQRFKNNIQSIKVLFFAEKLAQKYKLQQKISYQGILFYIGYILWDLDKPANSISYFKQSLATGHVLSQDSMVALNGLGMNYQKLDSPEQSLHYFNEAGRIAIAAKNDVFNTVVLGSAAATLLQLGQEEKAYDYSMRYKNLSVQNGLWENAVDAFHRLILMELKKNNSGQAKVLLDSLNSIMPNIKADDLVSVKRQKEAIYLYHEKQQDYRQALAAYKEFVHYDSLFQDYGNKNKISELELNAEVRLYEEEMAAKERAKNTRDTVESVAVVIFILVMVLLGTYWYRKIKKAEQAKKETEKLNLEQAGEIESLKLQLLEQLATIRNDHIHYQAIMAAQQDVEDKEKPVNNITIEPDAKELTVNTVMNEENDQKPDDIQLLKEYNLTQKEHWAAFKESFRKIYPDFEDNITSKIGAVSGAELRLMMLTKLGLSNKEIAQTLLISPDSVKKGKYRLYKKIGINSAAELHEFL